MPKSLNEAKIIGYLGQDPQMNETQAGTPVANISVATSYKPKDQDEVTEWHRVTLWDRLAEIAEEYLHKGSRVYISGYLQTRKWEDKEGIERYTTSIVATNLIMLDSKKEQDEGEDRGERRSSRSKPASRRREAQPVPDDDIPF